MSIIPRTGIFRYVKHRDAEAYCKLGWLPTDIFEGTYHEQFSVCMTWLCDCAPVEPQKNFSEIKSVGFPTQRHQTLAGIKRLMIEARLSLPS